MILPGQNIYKTTINATTLLEKSLTPITIDLKFGVQYMDGAGAFEQLVAYERIDFLCTQIFNGSLFLSRYNPKYKQLQKLIDTRMVECWEEPFDQFIATVILSKAMAVTDGYVYINFVSIECHGSGEGMEFMFDTEEIELEESIEDAEWAKKLAPVGEQMTWYYRNDLSTTDNIVRGASKKPTIENTELTWEDIGLSWTVPTAEKKKRISNVKQFVPRIVK